MATGGGGDPGLDRSHREALPRAASPAAQARYVAGKEEKRIPERGRVFREQLVEDTEESLAAVRGSAVTPGPVNLGQCHPRLCSPALRAPSDPAHTSPSGRETRGWREVSGWWGPPSPPQETEAAAPLFTRSLSGVRRAQL